MPTTLSMALVKPTNTFRIFILGESAALGDPRPHFGAGRYLQALLRDKYPDREFEVVNTAMTAINSHVILPIARECVRHKGDVWIIYMGNNEMVGPFGAATVFGPKAPPLAFVRVAVAIQKTRIGQLLVEVSRKLKARSPDADLWGGMEMFLKNRVLSGDSRKERVYSSFRSNLQDILRTGASSGAKIVLSSVALNLKDCPPFASEKGWETDAGSRELWEQAEQARKAGKYTEAAERLSRAVKAWPNCAVLRYALAECLLSEGNTNGAGEAFKAALDMDALPFRTDSRLNGIIAESGKKFAGTGLAYCDAAGALGKAATSGIPGQESFFEHVHLNFQGNYRVARAWAEEVARLLGLPKREQTWASQEECDRLLGLTDWNRVSVFEEMLERCSQPPLSTQPNNGERSAEFSRAVRELRQRMQTESKEEARAVYVNALKRWPADHSLHETYAEFLEGIADFDQAVAERKRIRDLTPQRYLSHLNLGTLLKERGRYPEAEECLVKAAELAPFQQEVCIQLGSVYALEKKEDLALAEFERARQISPNDPRVLVFRSEVLWRLGKHPESLNDLWQAIALKPDYADAHYRLGEKLALGGDVKEAAAEFREVVRLNPDHLKARLNLGVALLKMGQPEQALVQADAALRLDPQNTRAIDVKRAAERELRN